MTLCLLRIAASNGQKIDSIAHSLCVHGDINEGLKLLHQLGISTDK